MTKHMSGTRKEWLTARLELLEAGAADWLCLAASPTFAMMALAGVLGGGRAHMLCAATHDSSLLSGMIPMYVLMSAFHSAPWLKLTSSRRNGARRS